MKSETPDAGGEWPQGPGWDVARRQLEAVRHAKRSTAGQQTIERLAWAIRTLAATEGRISASNIGRLCEKKWGGPKAQTILNDTDGYAEVVRLAKMAQGERRRARLPRAGEELLDRVHDPSVRAEIQVLIADLKMARAETAALRGAIRRVQPLGRITAEMAFARVDTLQALSEAIDHKARADGPAFTVAEAKAVARFLADLPKEGLALHEPSGEIVVVKNGRTFASADVASALLKVGSGATASDGGAGRVVDCLRPSTLKPR